MGSKTKNLDYSSVPSTVELENNTNQNKYTVNRSPKGGVTLSKLALFLMALGALLLIALAVGLTIWLYPGCSAASPAALTQSRNAALAAVRLPTALEPLHYRLQLIPHLDQRNFTSNGAVTITLKANADTDKIVLNMYDIVVSPESVKVSKLNSTADGGTNIEVTDQKYDNISQTYTIYLKENLMKGEHYDVVIGFVGQLNDKMQGFYRSSYIDPKTNATRWMASTQFSPTDARRAFPCFDEPSFKAKFTISIGRPHNMTTISNMPKRTTDPIVPNDNNNNNNNLNWEWDHYVDTPKMSSYLVAFIMSDLQAHRYNGGKFTVWSRMRTFDQTRLVLELSPKLLTYYENYFNINFPLPKIDLVAVPDFGFNAMENWGLITFRETALLFDERTATVEDERNIVNVLSHELAHQWFGNLVTPGWWDDLWLKEGFANYLVYPAVSVVIPQWSIMDEFLSYETYAAFAVDVLKSSRPISFEVTTTEDIRQSFDSLSYSKGASVVRMLNHILGEEDFQKGLRQYLNQHQYGNAHRDDLWNALTPQNGSSKLEMSIKEVMDTWTRQAGFPVITAIRNESSGEVHVSQKRFLLSKAVEDKTLWWVPISYTTDSTIQNRDTTPKVWLKNEPQTTFSLTANRWWLLNVDQTGYYIVNYDERNWKTLIDHLMGLPPITRTQLISDSMYLARANLLDYDIPLKMLTNIGIRDEQISFITHYAAFDRVSFLYNMLVSTPSYKKFEDFLFRIFNRAFTKYNFNEASNDEYTVKRTRRLIVDWSCKKSGSECTNEARVLFRKWVERPNQALISPNVQKVVFCTAIREGGETEWNLAYKQYVVSNSIYEKNIILDALGCSQTPWILSRYLDLILKNNSDIRKQDSSRVFKSVANNPVGYSLAFTYLRTHWNQLNEHYGPAFSIVSKMVAELPTFMNTQYQLEEVNIYNSLIMAQSVKQLTAAVVALKDLENFKNSNINNLGTSAQAFDRAIEIVKTNVEWMNHSYNSVEKWLDEHSNHYGFRK